MLQPRRKHLGWLMLALGCAALLLGPQARSEEWDQSASPVRIGLVGSLFKDVPDALIAVMSKPFNQLMVAQTGLSGELVKTGDPLELGRLLADDKVQLGIFHGIDFAWARQQCPKLKPLMLAVNEQSRLRAFVIVRRDCPAKGLGDLKGQTLTLPRNGRPHCALFLERRCHDLGQPSDKLLGKIALSPCNEDALDEVVDGTAQATVMDSVSWACFKQRKPGRAAKLKIVQKSEVFPAAVVAYYPGSLDKKSLRRFREGMLSAHESTLGKSLLTMWKLTGFEEVPEDYEQLLSDIVKVYPPPPGLKK
jgi:ABC-type phosphate/phosphonate transport system substrate-binding protein